MEEVIEKYFKKGHNYSDILRFLKKFHNIDISLSTLKRALQSMNLKRKNVQESPATDIARAIVTEIYGSGYNLGYRSLWLLLQLKYGLVVKRQTVYNMLKAGDPEGIAARFGNKLRRRIYSTPGPNHLWHLDGWDKLGKLFGLYVHACIDGFSRYIIWLRVANSNKDPKVTAHYFLSAVKKLGALPSRIRTDKGTENVNIESLQLALRNSHADKYAGPKSYLKGKSCANQRIESWWRQMRQHSGDYYIQIFNKLRDDGEFDDSVLHQKCLRYCFGPLIQYDLTMTRTLWNRHRIRNQKGRSNVCDKPQVMYNVPEKYGCADGKISIQIETINNLLASEYVTEPILVDPEMEELVQILIPDAITPTNTSEALHLYRKILQMIVEREQK